MEKMEFYRNCAEILGTEYEEGRLDGPRPSHRTGEMRTSSKTRWNNRNPGNGRYPGFGIVRVFGPTLIHVSLHSPVGLVKEFNSYEDALDALRSIMNGTT